MSFKEFIKPTWKKIIITLLVSFILGLLIKFWLIMRSVISKYAFYFPFPFGVIQTSCGVGPGAKCELVFGIYPFVLNLILLLVVYIIVSIIIKNKKLQK